jgi:hypothetical protein
MIRLYDWAINYVKNRDLIVRSIVDIKEEKDHFLVEYSNKKTVFLVVPDMADLDGVLGRLKSFDGFRPSLVMLNTRENLKRILSNWEKLKSFDRHLCLIVVNPDSETEKKWMVFPHTHSLISEESSLELGLKAMADTVDVVDETEISKF